jgi:hypothetical protein
MKCQFTNDSPSSEYGRVKIVVERPFTPSIDTIHKGMLEPLMQQKK